MAAITRVSDKGLEELARAEGVVRGLYDCPAKHATFGVGSLVHKGPSELLRLVKSPPARKVGPGEIAKPLPDLSSYIKLYKVSKNSPGVPYLDADIGKDKDFSAFLEALPVPADKTKFVEQESALLTDGWSAYEKTFRERITKYEKAVSIAFAGISLTQRQFDGLFSLSYNIGDTTLLNSRDLIQAMKSYNTAPVGATREQAADAVLECVLRARPTSPARFEGEVEGATYSLVEPGVFNEGLFKRRVVEAGMILGQKVSEGDAVVQASRKTIKAQRDHAAIAPRAQEHARALIDGLKAIGRINRGGL